MKRLYKKGSINNKDLKINKFLKNNKILKNNRIIILIMMCMFSLIISNKTFAATGDMFYLGGITEGKKLEKTVDKIVDTKKKKTDKTFNYKEPVALDGNLKIAECNLTVKTSGTINEKNQNGSYSVTYTFKPKASSLVKLTRTVTLDVKYRKAYNQTIKDYTINKWQETIVIGEDTYKLDEKNTKINIPTIEYSSPGIMYYKTTISNQLVYERDKEKVTVVYTGQGYGYESFWSTVETQDINVSISSTGQSKDWQMIYNLKPNVTVNKTMKYDTNVPYAIGFAGNYLEIIKNKGGLKYEITLLPDNNKKQTKSATISIPDFNSQEQLIAPLDIDVFKGNFAEEDMKKLFSMEILEGSPKYYVPNQALTRSQYIRILVRALGLKPYDEPSKMMIFEDVDSSHPNYPYIVTAYQKGIIKGVGNGEFYPDSTINRQEAFVIYMRALGLQNLASYYTSVTPFLDDDKIDNWAKRDILALYNLGLINGDNGNIKPKALLSKAEGAAIVNRMIDYLRTGIEDDYVKNIMSY